MVRTMPAIVQLGGSPLSGIEVSFNYLFEGRVVASDWRLVPKQAPSRNASIISTATTVPPSLNGSIVEGSLPWWVVEDMRRKAEQAQLEALREEQERITQRLKDFVEVETAEEEPTGGAADFDEPMLMLRIECVRGEARCAIFRRLSEEDATAQQHAAATRVQAGARGAAVRLTMRVAKNQPLTVSQRQKMFALSLQHQDARHKKKKGGAVPEIGTAFRAAARAQAYQEQLAKDVEQRRHERETVVAGAGLPGLVPA